MACSVDIPGKGLLFSELNGGGVDLWKREGSVGELGVEKTKVEM